MNIFKNNNISNSRHEFKYVINESLVPVLETYLGRVGLKKDLAQKGSYPVTSLYFDTPFLSDYYDKVDGVKYRRKLRARIYQGGLSESEDVWLEIKEKHDMSIHKIRSCVKGSHFKSLLKGVPSPELLSDAKGDKKLSAFLYHFFMKNYRPMNIVHYYRTAYVADFHSEIRLTLDRNMSTCMWRDFVNNKSLLEFAPAKVVLEVKFKGAMPWWFKDMVGRFKLSRLSFSKYLNAVDQVRRHYPIAR